MIKARDESVQGFAECVTSILDMSSLSSRVDGTEDVTRRLFFLFLFFLDLVWEVEGC